MNKKRKARKYRALFGSVSKPNDIREKLDRFETKSAAYEEQRIRINRLIKTELPEYIAIAEILKKCLKGKRCWNAACPVCMRCYRRRHFALLWKVFKDIPHTSFITLLPAKYIVSIKDLGKVSLKTFKMMLTAQLNRAGFQDCIIIGGCELAFDQTLLKCILHFHVIIGEFPATAIERLRTMYDKQNKKKLIFRPIKEQPVKNREKQFSYTLKSFPSRRGINMQTTFKPNKTSRVPEPYHTQLLQFYARYQPQDFAFLYGVTQRGAKVYDTTKKPWVALKF